MADCATAWNFCLSNEVPFKDGKPDGKVITDNNGGMARYGINSLSHPEAVTDGFYEMSDSAAYQYASDIFHYDYFNATSGYNIADQAIASKFADMAFNQGVHQATMIVQRAVNSLRDNANLITIDGTAGARTVASINAVDEKELMAAIIEYGTAFYKGLRDNFPAKYSEALYEAWIKRLQKVSQ